MSQLPEAFIRQMADQLGDSLPKLLAAMEAPAWRGLRLNPLKLHDPESVLTVGDQIPWEKTGRYIHADSQAGSHVLHKAGAWYIQEPSAMIPVAVLDPQPGEWILDLCAAPGGKSSQIGERMAGQGLLVSNEPVFQRAEQLSRTIETAGIVNALVTSAVPEQLSGRWQECFDGVLVDAPCSGSGMFRKYPAVAAAWQAEEPEGCAKRQAKILEEACRMVRPGGRMVYSTCSLDRRENEDQIQSFLLRHPEFELEPFFLPEVNGTEGMITCYPFQIRGEGHFAALLRKSGKREDDGFIRPVAATFPSPDKQSLQAWEALSGGGTLRPDLVTADEMISSPHTPDCWGISVLRKGLRLAYRKGKTWLPHHAWAMSEKTGNMPVLSLTEDGAIRYMAGEEIASVEEVRGFAAVAYAGYHVGWVKASHGVLKNHLPKGLRISRGLMGKA